MLVTPPPTLIKVASNRRPCSKLGGRTLNGGRKEVSIISHGPVTSSDLKHERLFFRASVSTFLQLVVALTAIKAQPREDKGDREGIPHTHPIP